MSITKMMPPHEFFPKTYRLHGRSFKTTMRRMIAVRQTGTVQKWKDLKDEHAAASQEDGQAMERMTMTEKLTTLDVSEALASDEALAIFMEGAFETGDASYIAHAIGVVARARYDATRPRNGAFARTALSLV